MVTKSFTFMRQLTIGQSWTVKSYEKIRNVACASVCVHVCCVCVCLCVCVSVCGYQGVWTGGVCVKQGWIHGQYQSRTDGWVDGRTKPLIESPVYD